ncbi:MAG: ABC transporter permease [Salinigranum sp.]
MTPGPGGVSPEVIRGAMQILAALVVVAAVMVATRLWGFESAFERDVGFALGRGIVQLLIVGSVVGLLFTVPLPATVLVLAAMMVGGALIARNRAEGFPSAFRVSLAGVVVGPGLVIAAMIAGGVVAPTVRNLVPVGSMIIANGMKTSSLALERFTGEIEDNRARIEGLLSLGVPAGRAVDRPLRRGVQSSLVPVVDSLRSLGFVWIPGLMAGMVLGGSNPVYAAEYQFAVVAMIFAASALSSLVCGYLVRSYAFTDADQLRVPAASD